MTTPRLSRSRASHNGERSAGQSEAPALDLAVVIPAKDEIDNLLVLLPRLERTLAGLSIVAQTIVVVSEPDEAAEAALERLGARVIVQREAGYGSALQAGIAAANARYILTMDGDLSHSPGFIERLWQRRHAAEVVIASRYVPGGSADMPTGRYANWEWRVTERLYGFFAPGGYADEHIGHYTRAELIARYEALGYSVEAVRYILRGELILAFRKPLADTAGPARSSV